MTNRAISSVLPALLPAGLLLAQDTVTLKVETRAVQINVAVKDHQGRPIRGLRKEDFTITDDGRRREIQMFSSEDEPPFNSDRFAVLTPAITVGADRRK